MLKIIKKWKQSRRLEQSMRDVCAAFGHGATSNAKCVCGGKR